MQKNEITILIVDDDASLGKGMSEALKRSGFKAVHVTKPDEAIAFAKLQTVHVAIIDCMLPKMNGRDLAKKLKAEISNELTTILISGIYKDKQFAREAMQQTGATAFITKPFELDAFLNQIEDAIKLLIDQPIAPMWAMLAKQDITAKERMIAVDEMEVIHGFEVPWVLSLLMHPKVSGHLNIITADGDVCGVGFLNGEIVQVYQEDLKSYFGALLVEHGYISQEDLDGVMQSAGNTKRLGERLVEANLLSPHAIDIVMAEQQGIRLGKAIQNTSVKMNFIESEEMKINSRTDRSAFSELLNDWILSKLSVDWMKSFYTPWMQYNLKKGPDYSDHHRILATPVLSRAPGIMNLLLTSDTLEQAAEKMADQETNFFRALHALTVSRVLRFGEANSTVNFEIQRTRLKKLIKTLDQQNHYERLGLNQKAKESEIKRSFHELAKVLHPDKLGPETPADVRELGKQAFEKINEAYMTLAGETTRANYNMEIEKGNAQASLRAESLSEEARSMLKRGDFKKARETLEEAVSLAPPNSELKLLLMWSKLKGVGADKDRVLLDKVKDEITAIPAEDRLSANFYFVKAVLMRHLGEVDSAKRNLDRAISVNPDFIEARRELSTLNSQTNKPVDLLHGDLKTVVGMLFKKKKA